MTIAATSFKLFPRKFFKNTTDFIKTQLYCQKLKYFSASRRETTNSKSAMPISQGENVEPPGPALAAEGKDNGTGDLVNLQDIITIDLRSDTVTRPTDRMRLAMSTAEVGDDVFEEDPTVQALESMSAKLLGMDAGLYVPSGTMSNLIAILTHCNRRGSEFITGDSSHIFLYEQGGAAQFGGVAVNTVLNLSDGTFDLNDMMRRVRTRDLHEPITSLVCVENTHNLCGGKVLPIKWLKELVNWSSKSHIPLHMDGARLYNASIHLNVPAKDLVEGFSSVSVCLSKGLGAPVGSVLHGSYKFIHEARRIRKALGGGMRQCGVIAAAGIIALESMVNRLADDHKNARALAQGINNLNHPMFKIDLAALQTNIIRLEVDPIVVDSKDFCEKLYKTSDNQKKQLDGKAICIRAMPFGNRFIRMVLHHHISADLINLAIQKIAIVIKEYPEK